MKRSDFCKSMLTPGLACGCAMGLSPLTGGLLKAGDSAETPCEEKMDFTQNWVKRFFEIVDQQLDEPTRNKLMQTNGMACARGAYGEFTGDRPATIEEIDQKIAEWQKRIGNENIYRQEGIVFFSYVGNPKGLRISDGYCLCPMIENKPETLSPTYCQCSVGYVRYMFQRYITFKPVEVELLESVRTGGKGCRFKVIL